MYTLTVFNEKQEPIFINGRPFAEIGEIATHFIQATSIYIDLLNGGQTLSRLIQSNSSEALNGNEEAKKFTISTTIAPQMAFTMFIRHLHGHPYFDAKKMHDNTNPNKDVFKEIATLLHTTTIQSRADRVKVNNVLQRFVVPGIGKMLIQSDAPANEQALDAIDFPEELIPEAFHCSLTSTIMDDPCYDEIHDETIYDRKNIEQHLAKNPKNPHTNTPLKPTELKPALALKAHIQQFICNANFIANLFLQKNLESTFKTYIQQIEKAENIESLKKSLKEIMLPLLISKYKIKSDGLFPPKSDLEKCLRRAASEGNAIDVSILITLYEVDVNCHDEQHKKTPAHWVAQRFSEAVESQSKDAITSLQDCFDLLVDHNADIDLKAKNGKTAREMYLATEPALTALYGQPNSNTLRQ